MKTIAFALLTSVSLIAMPDNVSVNNISVDVERVLTDVSSKPLGINTDFFVDDDANRPGQRNLDQALAEMGVKYLRYPGGEKSDGYLWSVPPYDRSQPALARWAAGDWPQNQQWPSYDRNLVKSDGRTFVKNPLDFDEFMRLTRTVNGEPVLVVAYDSMYKAAQANGSAPTRAQLLETARQWVRYANVIKGYNVKYWEIGNESYLPGYNSDYISPETYAQDVIEFSQVMKSVDPSIKIIANGNDWEWWRVVLTQAGPAVDLLSVHSYPPYGWGGYDYYRTHDVDLMSAVHLAEQALDAYAGPNDAQRIKIAVTEMNTIDWSGSWASDNDTGHAIVLFDTVGDQLNDPRIEFSQVWNTRWVTNDSQRSPTVWDTLDKDNNLQATGRAMSIWGQFMLDTMVAASSTPMVKVFASYSAGGALNLFLINKDTSARVTNVSLANFVAQTGGDRWVFKGSGADDLSPVLAQAAPIAADGNRLSVTLDPVSITVLQLQKAAGAAEPPAGSRVLFEDFEGQSAASWTPAMGSWAACKPSANTSWEYCVSSASENVSLAGSSAWRDYYVQAYVNLDSDAWSGVTILGRVQDATHFYQAELRRDGSGNKTWMLSKNSGGRWSYISSGYFDYAARNYYLLRLSMVGSSISVSISTDWGASFQQLGTGSDTEFGAGKVGLRSWGSPASFDYVEVRLQ